MTELEKNTLTDALIWAGCRRIPKKDDGKGVWINAIALVAKSDGSKSYCIVERMFSGDFRVIKDFGHAAAIKQYVSIHPYEYVKEKYIKKFSADATREVKIRYINTNLGTGYDTGSLTDEELEKELISVAIYKQKKDTEK